MAEGRAEETVFILREGFLWKPVSWGSLLHDLRLGRSFSRRPNSARTRDAHILEQFSNHSKTCWQGKEALISS